MAGKTASFPVIGLGLDPSGIAKGLSQAVGILKGGMKTLKESVSAPLFGVALANQAAEFGQKINRLFLEPFRQLMAQEDLGSRFSVLAGGTDKAGIALDRFKSISRDTGLSMGEMSTSLDALLQGQFSFQGAMAQIQDLSKVASVLGEGSLPQLAQAAAKFRSSAFAGFEDLNGVAAMGLPIFDALAQQLNVTADQAKKMAKDGLITGLQARNALNDAAAKGAANNGGGQEQTLSGVVSRLKEGLNQTLAEIGSAVSKVIDVPTLLSRFRGFLDGVRSFFAAAFGPLLAIGKQGNLQQAFDAARNATLSVLQVIGNGIIDLGTKLLVISNHLIDIYNRINEYFSGGDPEKGVRGLFNKVGAAEFGLGEWLAKKLGVDFGENPFGPEAIQKARAEIFQPVQKFNAGGGEQLKANFAKMIDNARNQGNANQAAADAALAAAKLAENLKQAKDQLLSFADIAKSAFGNPFDNAVAQLQKFNAAFNDAVNQGVGDPGALFEQNKPVLGGIGKMFLDAADAVNSKFNEIKLAGAASFNSKEGYDLLAKAVMGAGTSQQNPQERIRLAVERQTDLQKKQLDAGLQAVEAIKAIPVAQGGVIIGF